MMAFMLKQSAAGGILTTELCLKDCVGVNVETSDDLF